LVLLFCVAFFLNLPRFEMNATRAPHLSFYRVALMGGC